MNLPEHAPAGAVEVLQVRDPFSIGDPGHPVVAVILIPRRPAFGIGHRRQVPLSIIGLLHRPPDGIAHLRDAIAAVIVERQLAPIRSGDGGDVGATICIGHGVPGAIDLLRQTQVDDPERSAESRAEHPERAIFPPQRRHAARRGEHPTLQGSIGAIAIGAIRLNWTSISQ